MEKLSIYGNYEIDGQLYSKDDILNLYRLQNQMLLEESMIVSIFDCEKIWSNYSNNLAASWLDFPKEDKSILSQIKSDVYFVSFEESISNA